MAVVSGCACRCGGSAARIRDAHGRSLPSAWRAGSRDHTHAGRHGCSNWCTVSGSRSVAVPGRAWLEGFSSPSSQGHASAKRAGGGRRRRGRGAAGDRHRRLGVEEGPPLRHDHLRPRAAPRDRPPARPGGGHGRGMACRAPRHRDRVARPRGWLRIGCSPFSAGRPGQVADRWHLLECAGDRGRRCGRASPEACQPGVRRRRQDVPWRHSQGIDEKRDIARAADGGRARPV